MTIGDRVRIITKYSSFNGFKGTVADIHYYDSQTDVWVTMDEKEDCKFSENLSWGPEELEVIDDNP